MHHSRVASSCIASLAILLSFGRFAAAASDVVVSTRIAEYLRIDLGTLGGLHSRGVRINDRGHVVGQSTNAAGQSRLFLWNGSSLVDLGITAFEGIDLNRKDQVCGTTSGPRFAFIYDGGAAQNLDFDIAVDLNDHGALLGFNVSNISGAPGPYAPLIWDRGEIRLLPTPGHYSIPRAFNNRGEAVGEMGLANGDVKAIIWRPDGSYDTALLSGATMCSAGAINDRGQAIGFCDGPTKSHGFFWHAGVMRAIDVGGPLDHVDPLAINERGQIIGTYGSDSNRSAGFIWEDGVATDLGKLPGLVVPPGYAVDYEPLALNERAQVVGYAIPSTGDGPRAFVWEAGAMADLGPGTAWDINERGEILGQVGNHAVVWRPVKRSGGASARSGPLSTSGVMAPATLPKLAVRIASRPGTLPVEYRISGAGARHTAALFDVQGRLVTRLASLGGGAGSWNGTNREGTHVAPGIYFLHVDAGDARATKKILIR